MAILKIITSIIFFYEHHHDHHHHHDHLADDHHHHHDHRNHHDHLDDDDHLNLQSALKSPPSTTGAAAETAGGSLKTAEKLVCARCFKQWMSEGDYYYY